MTGAAAALAGTPTGVGAGVGGVVVPAPAPVWTNCNGDAAVSTNTVTIAAITVPIAVEAANSGSGILFYNLNGGFTAYSGAFTVNAGDALGWTVANSGSGRKTGTITVINHSNGDSTIATFTYSVTDN